MRTLLLALAVAGLGSVTTVPGVAQAQAESGRSMSVPMAPNAPDRYVVKKGDTLWDIAGVFLKDPWYWPEIWYVNPSIVNPHLIYPGDELYLTYVDGKPRVTVGRAGAERLSPQVRTEPLARAVRAIPHDLLMKFVGRPALLDKDDVKKRPYIVGIRDDHVVGTDQNEVYAKELGRPAVGTRYTIIHAGEELRDPDDGDLLGYIGHYAGTGSVIDTTSAAKGKDLMTHLSVVDTGREILPGDKLFPANVEVGDDFILSAPKNEKLDGQVIAVVDGVYVAGRFQVLAINRGKRDGLVPGNAVAIFQRGESVRDYGAAGPVNWRVYATNYDTVQLPKERSGTMLLFQVYDRMSYGLVVESTTVMRRGDYIKHPYFGHRDVGTRDVLR
jgi:hypothetical protein